MRVILSVSGRGLISLPAKLRQEAGIQLEGSVIAETTPEGILLKPAVTLAMEIYSGCQKKLPDKKEPVVATFLWNVRSMKGVQVNPRRPTGPWLQL